MAYGSVRTAESANKVLDRVLLTLSETGPVLAGTKEFHQQEAMSAAESIRSQYSDVAKKKARSDCVSHLRASLSRPVAAGSSDLYFRTDSV